MEQTISLEAVRRDLVAHLYGLAHALDTQIRPGAGSAMLGRPTDEYMIAWPEYEEFDLSGFQVGTGLEVVYRYAVLGEISAGAFINDDPEDGNLGRLESLVEMVRHEPISDRFEEACGERDQDALPRGGLTEVIRRASARLALDTEEAVSLPNIAQLAGMNERSVRNALHASGDAMLAAFRDSNGELMVKQAEALRWLRGRRGFTQTVTVGSHGASQIPEMLGTQEIIPFITNRINEYHSDGMGGFRYANAGRRAGWTEERVRALVTGQPEDIDPEDCSAIARMLYVDSAWFTTQVLRARFPGAMQEVQPAPAQHATPASPLDEEAQTLDVALTEAGIRNGYFDIESRYADRFFPADCYGDRGAGETGVAVSFRYSDSGETFTTDLRVKTKTLVSPRKRFTSYFNSRRAKAGDTVRITRRADRNYELTFIAK